MVTSTGKASHTIATFLLKTLEKEMFMMTMSKNEKRTRLLFEICFVLPELTIFKLFT